MGMKTVSPMSVLLCMQHNNKGSISETTRIEVNMYQSNIPYVKLQQGVCVHGVFTD